MVKQYEYDVTGRLVKLCEGTVTSTDSQTIDDERWVEMDYDPWTNIGDVQYRGRLTISFFHCWLL